MRNNDYDFIKNKFDNAVPAVPHGITPQVMADKIRANQQHKTNNTVKFEDIKSEKSEQKKRINFKPLITAAACFILALGIFASVNQFNNSNENKAYQFKDDDELNTVVADLEKWGSGEGMGSGGSWLFQDIYTPDDLKNSGKNVAANDKYIFYSYYDYNNSVDRNKLYIFSADGENSKLINIMNDVAPNDDYYISDIFLVDNSLTVTVSDDSDTIIKTYDVSDPANPILINEIRQDGMLMNSYMIDGIAYLVSFYGVAQQETEDFVPKSENLSIKAKNIYRFDNIKTANYMVIGAVDVKSGKVADETRAILGCYYETYITDGYLYVANDNAYWTNNRDEIEYIKYDLKTGKAVIEAPERVNLPSCIELSDGSFFDVNDTLIRIDDNRLISITSRVDLETRDYLDGQEIVLYDVTDMSNPIELDKLILEDSHGCSDIYKDENGIFSFSTYFADDERRYYGANAFEIKNDKIELKDKFINEDDNLMYQGSGIVIGDYIYSFDHNDNAEDNKKLTIYPHKLG
ncbi:MAG: beta-propeller domain-containing protein [Eubacterium sp.]|nr:beta-propeller domain-containing protein [Eubacterium sp.]